MSRKPTQPARSRPHVEHFANVSFSGYDSLGPVMLSVPSKQLSKAAEKRLIADAWEFHIKGLFVQELTNPAFLKVLAKDCCKHFAPLKIQQRIAALVAKASLDSYFDRLEKALATESSAVLERTKNFLAAKPRTTKTGRAKTDFVATLTDGYAEELLEGMERLIAPFFEKPSTKSKANFWAMYATWIWTNQIAQAIQTLEEKIGMSKVEGMKPEKLYSRALKIYCESPDVIPEFVRLTDWYINDFARILSSHLNGQPLDQLEYLLLLRKRSKSSIVLLRDLTSQIGNLVSRPHELSLVPPRRFEEMMAFALSKSGYENVTLTPQTRDGGFDINAIRTSPTKQRLIVECKRYSEALKVGRPILDALLGVLHREGANQALLATTSSFSREALELLEREPWRLSGMDRNAVLKLLRQSTSN